MCPLRKVSMSSTCSVIDDPLQASPNSGSGPRRVTPPPRILHLINGEHYAGAERVQDLLAQRLPHEGFEVEFACLKGERFPVCRTCQQTPLWNFRMERRFDLRPIRQVLQLVRDRQYSLLHCHTPRSALVGRLVAHWSGLPLVYHVHSPTAQDTTHRWRNRMNQLVERLATRGKTHCIAVSQSLARHMAHQGIANDRISVVCNGVPCSPLALNHDAPTGEWVLGTVALFRPRKGLEVLLQSLGKLRNQGLPVRLRAIGNFETPAYEAQVKQLANSLGVSSWVEWTGFSQQVTAEMRRLDALVLPSLFGEGLPMVVLEAMAIGLPVVATQVEGIPEAIRDGVDGLLATPGDAAALAATLAKLVEGHFSYRDLSQNARRRQTECFSDVAMAAGVARVYRTVLGG